MKMLQLIITEFFMGFYIEIFLSDVTNYKWLLNTSTLIGFTLLKVRDALRNKH